MRGYKAKALRKLALALHPETPEDMGYIYPNGRYALRKHVNPLTRSIEVAEVTGQMVHASKAHRLYKHMKKDLTNGGT